MYDTLIGYLKKQDIEYVEYGSIKKLTSIKIDTLARIIVFPDSVDALVKVLDLVIDTEESFLVVGKMSNVLFRDALYDGVIINTSKLGKKSRAERDCVVECGAMFSSVIRYMSAFSLGGGEALYQIPGSVGGMVYSNAGAFGTEVSDMFIEGSFFDVSSKVFRFLCRDEMNFAYRHSILAEDSSLILLEARLRFDESKYEDIQNKIAHFKELRKTSQPSLPSLGSIFKRVDGVGAGYYIDRAGLKGVRIGGAEISTKHAGFIINKGEARSSDVLQLIELIRTRVFSEFGISLENEIRII